MRGCPHAVKLEREGKRSKANLKYQHSVSRQCFSRETISKLERCTLERAGSIVLEH